MHRVAEKKEMLFGCSECKDCNNCFFCCLIYSNVDSSLTTLTPLLSPMLFPVLPCLQPHHPNAFLPWLHHLNCVGVHRLCLTGICLILLLGLFMPCHTCSLVTSRCFNQRRGFKSYKKVKTLVFMASKQIKPSTTNNKTWSSWQFLSKTVSFIGEYMSFFPELTLLLYFQVSYLFFFFFFKMVKIYRIRPWLVWVLILCVTNKLSCTSNLVLWNVENLVFTLYFSVLYQFLISYAAALYQS